MKKSLFLLSGLTLLLSGCYGNNALTTETADTTATAPTINVNVEIPDTPAQPRYEDTIVDLDLVSHDYFSAKLVKVSGEFEAYARLRYINTDDAYFDDMGVNGGALYQIKYCMAQITLTATKDITKYHYLYDANYDRKSIILYYDVGNEYQQRFDKAYNVVGGYDINLHEETQVVEYPKETVSLSHTLKMTIITAYRVDENEEWISNPFDDQLQGWGLNGQMRYE